MGLRGKEVIAGMEIYCFCRHAHWTDARGHVFVFLVPNTRERGNDWGKKVP